MKMLHLKEFQLVVKLEGDQLVAASEGEELDWFAFDFLFPCEYPESVCFDAVRKIEEFFDVKIERLHGSHSPDYRLIKN